MFIATRKPCGTRSYPFLGLVPHFLSSENKMNVEIKSGRYAIYDCPPKLKAFLTARESGSATKEMLTQLSADAMAEQQEELAQKPKATLIDFESAKERLK
jgi:hypothetical protein